MTMSTDPEHISCRVHGKASAAYVCGHLTENPIQRWVCAYPSEGDPWPDAWCSRCEEAFLREGEWNEKNESGTNLKVLCSHCYERMKGESVNRLVEGKLELWRSLVEECQRELRRKQDDLSDRYALWRHKRWDWNQDRGEIVFSNDGVPAVIAKMEFVGSVSTKSNTWLWSWGNSHTLDCVRSRISAVRDFGEAKDFPHLLVPKWVAAEVDGWEMTAVAVHVLGAEGAYRTPYDGGFTHMALSDVRFAQ